MSDPEDLVGLAESGVRAAEAAGADAAEVYVYEGRGDRVMKGRNFQMAQESDRSGVCVRVLRGNRLARASTDGIREPDLEWAIDRALSSVDYVPPSPSFTGFPETDRASGSPTSVHPDVAEPDVERVVGIAGQLGDQIEGTEGIDYFEIILGAGYGCFALANSQGTTAWDHNAYEQCNLELRFEHRGEHNYVRRSAYAREPLSYEADLRDLARDATRIIQATEDHGQLDRSAPTALFDAVATNTLLSKIMPAARGLAAARDRTEFAGMLGERVAVDGLTLVDEPRAKHGMRVQRTDDEGIPTRRTPIIQDGVLETYLYDWAAALETDKAPTGHGLRPSSGRHDGSPTARPCNLEVDPGDWTMDEMIEDVDRGLLVHGPFLGSFTSSPVTGDFSLVAPLAFLIEDGEVQHAVPSATVSGNFFDVLESIRAIGSETTRLSSGSFVPLLVDEVNCVA